MREGGREGGREERGKINSACGISWLHMNMNSYPELS